MRDIGAALRGIQATKKKLEQAGMQTHDIKQSVAAHSAVCELFVTRDWDFKNPKNKSSRSTKNNATAKIIRDELGLRVCLPYEACKILC
ncbi:hypothetical protein [Corallococcus llansteffanensis]|uniref:hypothetical protein n=1 Tax=Corallococcus llansteffanensis TaxID=2316731 RepID=UPI0011C4A894|nr:hypothetical protein [Corallococcus llansteffanensis]